MAFDFAAVHAPFRMQPGLRRVAPGEPVLHALAPSTPLALEKRAVLAHDAGRALLVVPGFDAAPAWCHLAAEAARQCPQAFGWDGTTLQARAYGVAVDAAGRLRARPGEPAAPLHAPGDPGEPGDPTPDDTLGLLAGLAPTLRLAGLLALALHEDFAVIDGRSARLPALAVCLPSHWDPREKIGRHFAEVHAPVADNALLLAAGEHLMALACGAQRWERFVWTITPHDRHDQHPGRHPRRPWPEVGDVDAVARAAVWRTERQSFLPMPARQQAVFTIQVECSPLAAALADPADARRVREALSSMSEAVLDYRQLRAVRPALLAWLDRVAAP